MTDLLLSGRVKGRHYHFAHRRFRRLMAMGLLAGTALAPGSALAQSWNGTTSTNWHTGTNWSNGAEPTSATAADITAAVPNQPVVQTGTAQAQTLQVGNSNAQNLSSLTIQQGAQLTIANILNLAPVAGTRGQLTLDGVGTNGNTNALIVGASGTGNLLIQNGASFTAAGVEFGQNVGGDGVASITGTGSSLSATNGIAIGDAGSGHIIVSLGATASADYLGAGVQAGSHGIVDLSDLGTHWTSNNLTIGGFGQGSLSVKNGATANIGGNGIAIGYSTGGLGTALIDGAGSSLSTSGLLQIGNNGTGTLQILNGAIVTDNIAFMGNGGSGSGNGTVDLIGVGSEWRNTTGLVVSGGGTSAVHVASGGRLTSAISYVGSAVGGTGTVTIDGTGSSWTATGLFRDGWAGRGTIAITHGGLLAIAGGSLGTGASGIGSLTISDTSSAFTSSADVQIGDLGQGTLSVLAGATATVTNLTIGNQTGSTGALIVDGAGSSLDVGSQLVVGADGSAQMSISRGGSISSQNVASVGSNGSATVSITGSGSSFTTKNMLVAGDAGAADISVSSGGAIGARAVQLGYSPGSAASLLIDGAGSSSTFGTAFAAIGGTASITVANGGALNVTGATAIGLELAQDPTGKGTLNIGADAASAAAAPGTINVPQILFGDGTGTVVLNHTASTYDLAAPLNGHGILNALAGTTRLTADSSLFLGDVNVTGGAVVLTGKLGGNVNVGSGTGPSSFGGTGTAAGTVTVSGHGALVGQAGQTFAMGNLNLGAASSTNVTLAAPGNAALFHVTGNLILDGTLNVTANAGFGPGLYRLIDYGGTLTDNGLAIGNVNLGQASDYSVQTSIAGQVNLISGVILARNFWDGDAPGSANNAKVDGGTGTWTATSANFTGPDGSTNGTLLPQPGFAIFTGTAGTVTIDTSAGAVAITGAQFAANGYAVQGGALTLAAGSDTIRVGDGTNAGQGFTTVIAASITGSGGLDKTDLGTLVLGGANSYSGGTRVSGGVLMGDATSLQGSITNNATLVFNQIGNGTYIGSLSGNGSLLKSGQGRLNLTGDSSPYTGTITVGGGLLSINGSLAGSTLAVANGATVGGGGTSGNIVVQNGGTIAPGNSIGTMTVAGNLALQAGSTYSAEVDPASGVSDLIAATGAASLAGKLNVASSTAFRLGQSFRILTANAGVGGSFSAVTVNSQTIGSFQTATVAYSTNAVDFTLDVDRVALAMAGITSNERAVSGAIAQLPGDNAVLGALAAGTTAQAISGFDQLSGEIHAAVPRQAFEHARLMRDTVLTHVEEGAGLWMQGLGAWGVTPGNGNYARAQRTAQGLAGGGAMHVAGGMQLGLALGYSQGGTSLRGRPGQADAELIHVAGYGSVRTGDFTLFGGAIYGDGNVSINRAVAIGGFGDALYARYRLRAFQAFGELGYGFRWKSAQVRPFMNLTIVRLHTDAFIESGGAAALSGSAKANDLELASTGLHLSNIEGPLRLSATIGWSHVFGDIQPVAQFAISGAPAFEISGSEVAQDGAVVSAHAKFRLSPSAWLDAGYNGSFGKGYDHSATASFTYLF